MFDSWLQPHFVGDILINLYKETDSCVKIWNRWFSYIKEKHSKEKIDMFDLVNWGDFSDL